MQPRPKQGLDTQGRCRSIQGQGEDLQRHGQDQGQGQSRNFVASGQDLQKQGQGQGRNFMAPSQGQDLQKQGYGWNFVASGQNQGQGRDRGHDEGLKRALLLR